MTVIRPNSIAGINSITAQGNSISIFKSDGSSGLELTGATINSSTGISTFNTLSVSNGAVISGVSTISSLNVTGTTTVGLGTTGSPSISPTGDSNTGVFFPSADTIAFAEGGIEAARFDSSGRLLVGTSSARDFFGGTDTPALQVEGLGNAGRELSVTSSTASGSGGVVLLAKQRSGAVGGQTIVQSGDQLGYLGFQGSDGTKMLPGAAIEATVDGTPGVNDLPTRLVFSTTADGASSPTERMRIDSAGVLKVSNNSTYAAGGYHQFNQNASSQWTLGVLGRNATDPYGIRVEYTNAAPNGTVSQFLYCVDTAGVKAEIRSNGGLANFQANNVNLSDRNAKKDIAPAAGTWNCVKEWEIINYHYKDQPDDADLNLGVIAQQVAESCPEVITVFQKATENEPEKLGVKEQQMYWMAIKALQEAMERIETLEQRLTDAGIA